MMAWIGDFWSQIETGVRRGRNNLLTSLAFFWGRGTDWRFSIVPIDKWQIANIVVVAVFALALTAVLFDPWLLQWRANLPSPVRSTLSNYTDLGKSHWMLIGSGLYFIAALFRDVTQLAKPRRLRRVVRAWAAFYVFACVAVSGVIVNIFKYGLGRARPRHFEEFGAFAFNPLSTEASWASFPSGHATSAASLAVALSLLFPRFAGGFLCMGMIVAITRMAAGAHYPSDVLGGCLLGALLSWVLARSFAARRLVFGFNSSGRLIRRHRLLAALK